MTCIAWVRDVMSNPLAPEMVARLRPPHRALLQALWPCVASLVPAYTPTSVLVLCRHPSGFTFAGILRRELALQEARRTYPDALPVHRHLLHPSEGLPVVVSSPLGLSCLHLVQEGGVLDLMPGADVAGGEVEEMAKYSRSYQ